MSGIRRIGLGTQALLVCRGPDAVRFLNGQLTQDLRRVTGTEISLPSCVTDAKGRLQFRVTVMEANDGELWVAGPPDPSADLFARLTRYLIADDVEIAESPETYLLVHFTGPIPPPPQGVLARRSNRFGIPGTDWWFPSSQAVDFPDDITLLEGDELEALRITNSIPAWGRELTEGLLPPEALLEATDISYQKGCYIGQEVISRIKSAGKVNKRLTRFWIDAGIPLAVGPLENAQGGLAGEITSVSPLAVGKGRHALGFVKRGASELFFRTPDGGLHPIEVA
jgi:folate-binding protein YgfZ